jgi:hypothetical protein
LSNWCLRRFKRSFAITSLDDFTANMPGPSGRNRRRLKSIAIS